VRVEGFGVEVEAEKCGGVHRVHEVVLGGRVHKIELQQIIDAKRLEQQDNVAQVCAHDFWDSVVQHFKFVAMFGVPTID
jgi:hypothetical protein